MTDAAAARLARLVSQKTEAELRAVLPAGRVAPTGTAPADVLLIKGVAGAQDVSLGTALAGEDGEAAHKALSALGWDTSSFAICTREGETVVLGPESLAVVVEAVDPDLVLALDGVAAADVGTALGIETLRAGEPVRVAGRIVLAIDGLEASLVDEDGKLRVWRQLKSVRRG
ncbi:MAG: hypothetical protein Q7J82_10200 [Coriobacteriia bacterium]|nr:hypothetical protein [Coriobacteriia bacterium]